MASVTRPLTRFLRLAAALSLVLATALTGVVASAPKAQAQEGWLSSAAAFSGRHANEMGLGGGQVGTAWVEGWLYHTVKWPAAVRAGQPFSFKRCIVRVGIEETTGYEGSVRTVHMDGQTFGVGPFNTQDSGEWGVGELCKTFTATAPSTPGTSVPFTAWSVPYNSYVGAGYAGSCCTVWEWLEEERAGFAYANNFYTGTYTFQIPTVYTNLTAANDGSALVQQSGSTTVNVLANDAGVTGGTGTVVAAPTGMAITSQATKGTCSITGTQVTYVNNGTAGADSCRYHVNQSSTDAEGPTNGPATATVYFNVSSKPTPQPDTVQTMDTQPVTTDPRRNDTDPNTADSPTLENNLPLTIIGARIISGGGSVSFTGTGITFDPLTDYYYLAPGQRATAVIEYTVRDSRGGINTSRVTVVVNGELSPPIVVEETAQVAESATTTYDPTANDLHLEPSSIDPIITSIDTSATKGGVTFTDNAITYNPKGLFESLAQGETASDVVTYTIFDGNLSDTGEALITIVGANDAPVATDDTAATTAGAAVLVDVLANDTDIDASDTHTVTDVAVTSGTGSVSISGNKLTYDPAGTYDYLAAGESATVLVTYTMSGPLRRHLDSDRQDHRHWCQRGTHCRQRHGRKHHRGRPGRHRAGSQQ